MRRLVILAFVLLTVGWSQVADASLVLSLDGSRTGDENEPGGDRFLTAPAMANATNVLLNAGFTVGTTPDFLAASIAGAGALYTGAVDVGFSAQEITDIQAFVSAGGGLVIQRDWGAFYPAADPLLLAFGVLVSTGAVGPGGTPNPVNDVTGGTHPIWNGPAGSVAFYDQVFSSSITLGATIIGTHQWPGNPAALGVLQFGLGRVVVLTDMDAWDDFGDTVSPVPGSNNAIVWENIFHYAAAGQPIPEPGTLTLLGIGLGGAALARRRRRG